MTTILGTTMSNDSITALSPHSAVGVSSFITNTTGSCNTAVGNSALMSVAGSEHVIQGEMLTTECVYTDDYVKGMSDDGIKSMMAIQLSKEMLARGHIEFTKQHDPIDMKVTIRARCFCVPNDDVQLLRKNGY